MSCGPVGGAPHPRQRTWPGRSSPGWERSVPAWDRQFPGMLSSFLAVKGSVVDPNTLHLDPDPEIWSNLNPDPLNVINFERKIYK